MPLTFRSLIAIWIFLAYSLSAETLQGRWKLLAAEDIRANGEVVRQEVYNNAGSRPRLVVNEQGEVAVAGGTRRVKPEELPVVPMVKAPGELPAKNMLPMPPRQM